MTDDLPGPTVENGLPGSTVRSSVPLVPEVPSAPPGPLPAVALRGVSKVYGSGSGAVAAIDDISLDVGPGEFVCVVGASGCGKSTLLNLVAGLDRPTTGRLDVQGRTALMFQEAALFPWLTVAGNVDLALKLRGIPKQRRVERVDALLQTVHLQGFAAKRPHELSGGMRQRVALARAFAQDADVLLMDEPFGALDAMTRDVLHDELEGLWRDRSLTIVFVTHNVREAARLADRIVVLSSRPGRVDATFEVAMDRPRRIESPPVGELAATVTETLRREVRRHADR
ncbi:MAG TPA: ABC transporter ATP-binding protein [Acidimicrobiales bacterium]|nr:ABC transporter ATP-binding protein [Acidimicrobiales bacterium]